MKAASHAAGSESPLSGILEAVAGMAVASSLHVCGTLKDTGM